MSSQQVGSQVPTFTAGGSTVILSPAREDPSPPAAAVQVPARALHPRVPYPDAVIPNLPRGADAWKGAIKQWNEKDSRTGCALKDWPVEWYTGVMRTINQAKRHLRQLVNAEFER